MNIVIVNDWLKAGGAEKVVVTAANLLHAKGIKVSLVLFLKKADLDQQLDPAIPVHYLNRTGRFSLQPMFLLKKLTAGADIVHIHSRHNLRYFMVARWLTFNYGPKIVYHEHTPRFRQLDRFTAFLLKRVDAYVAVVQNILAWAQQKQVVDKTKMHYLPNIVTGQPQAAGTYRQHAIMLAANFRSVKNHLFAIDLVEQLGPTFTLDIYGMVDEPAYYQQVVERIAKSNLAGRVKIIEGVSHLSAIMPRYHFGLHTANHETGPLVLLEYMQAGVPFLTYNTGDVAVNLCKHIPELVMDSFTISDWKERIFSVMLDHPKRHELQERMQQLLQQQFSSSQYINNLTGIYATVLANK